jgi:hypothetical protein
MAVSAERTTIHSTTVALRMLSSGRVIVDVDIIGIEGVKVEEVGVGEEVEVVAQMGEVVVGEVVARRRDGV